MSYTKKQRRPNYQAATIDSNSNPALFSFRRRRSTRRMAEHNDRYKDRKGNNQAVTINTSSDHVFLFFRGRRSTRRMAGHDVDHKMTKENDQAATIINYSDVKATINNNNLQLQRKAITNCVLLSLIWSECILRTNGVENIPHFRCDIHVLENRENVNPLYYPFYSQNQSHD